MRTFLRLVVLLGVLLSATAVAPVAYADPTVPPVVIANVTLDSHPVDPTTEAYGRPVPSTFTFHADVLGATFQCRLTGPGRVGRFGLCPGGTAGSATYAGLRGAGYVFAVRATADGGVTFGPATADFGWTVLDCANTATLCRVFAPDRYTVPSAAMFNNPLGTAVAKRRNLTHVIRTINSMPGYQVAREALCDPRRFPSSIRISLYSASDMAFAKALVAASRRCVSVQILMNNHLGPKKTPSIRYLQHYLGGAVTGAAGVRRSFAHRCHYGCRGVGVLHSKFYLFDSALTAPGGVRISGTVMVGSSNMTANASRVQWNDLYTVRGNATLHSQFLWMFQRMRRDHDERRTFAFASGPYRTTFTPQTVGSVDPTMTALRSIRCTGAGTTGLNGHSVVYINMHAWFGVRGYAFARQVRALHDQGCYVRVLYSFMSRSVFTKLTYGTGSRMSVRRTIFSKHGGVHANLYSHFKMVAAAGYVGGSRSASVVWTGSNNFTNDGVNFDEVTLRIASRAAYDQYRNQFAFITRTKSSGTYASFAEPIGGGRAIR